MIVKILYSLDHSDNLYLFKSNVSKINNFQLRVVKVKTPDSKELQTIGLVNLRQCVSLVVKSSPELFQLTETEYVESKLKQGVNTKYTENIANNTNGPNGNSASSNSGIAGGIRNDMGSSQSVKKKIIKLVDYSIYNKDVLEAESPLVGHGSLRTMFGTKNSLNNGKSEAGNNVPTVAGKILKSGNFLLSLVNKHEQNQENITNQDSTAEEYGNMDDFVIEQNADDYVQNSSYCLELKLKFMKFYKENSIQHSGKKKLQAAKMNTVQHKRTASQNARVLPQIGELETGPTVESQISNLKAEKASRTYSLPVFNGGNLGKNVSSSANMGAPLAAFAKPQKRVRKSMGNESVAETPSCFNCKAGKSTKWQWFKKLVPGTKKVLEGLICEECNELLESSDELKHIANKTKNAAKQNGTKKRKKAAKQQEKQQQSSEEMSIAESLAANRMSLEKQNKLYKKSEQNHSTFQAPPMQQSVTNQALPPDIPSDNASLSPKDAGWEIEQIAQFLRTPKKFKEPHAMPITQAAHNSQTESPNQGESPNSKWIKYMLQTITSNSSSPNGKCEGDSTLCNTTVGNNTSLNITDFSIYGLGLEDSTGATNVFDPLKVENFEERPITTITQALKELSEADTPKDKNTCQTMCDENPESDESSLGLNRANSSFPSSPINSSPNCDQ